MAGRVQLNEPAVPLRQATRLSLGEPTPPGPPTTAPTSATTSTTTVPPTTTTTVPPTTTTTTTTTTVPPTTTTTTTTVPTTTTTLPATSQEYLLVGDSLCVLSEADILIDAATAGILSELSIDCEGGRAPAAGVPIAVAHEPTPDVLMFELGTNPGDELQSMNAYDAVIGAFPHADIYFATGYREYPPGIQAGVDTLNDYMFVLAAAHDHVRVCDWAPVIQANTDWFVDSIHYDAEGEAEFAQFIVSCMLGDLHD